MKLFLHNFNIFFFMYNKYNVNSNNCNKKCIFCKNTVLIFLEFIDIIFNDKKRKIELFLLNQRKEFYLINDRI